MKLVGGRSGGPWAKLRYERHWATITMKSYEVIFQNFFKLTSKILRKRSGANTSTMRGRAWFSDLRFKSRSHHFTNEVLVQYSSCLGGSRYASLCMLYEDMHCGFFTIPLLRHPSVLFDKAPLAFTFYRHESYNKARSQSNEETPKANTVCKPRDSSSFPAPSPARRQGDFQRISPLPRPRGILSSNGPRSLERLLR
jgi:hypothetical protein